MTDGIEISVQADGTLEVGGDHLAIPNVFLHREIGRGANGVVLFGLNQILDREVAVKLWLTLRDNDTRDKYKQGVHEVRKVASAEFPFTPRVFDAGEIGQRVYVAMEYFHGQPLKSWWTSVSPDFAWRYIIAEKIDHMAQQLVDRELIHGDLHWGNVLVHGRHDRLPQFQREEFAGEVPLFSMRDEEIELKIVDFGTSYFSEEGFSISRHWRVYEDLIDRLLSPIEMRYIWSHAKPVDRMDSRKMAECFSGYLFWLYWILMHAFECEKICPLWHGDMLILTVEGHRYMRDLIDRHQLTEHDVEMMRPWMTLYDYVHSGML